MFKLGPTQTQAFRALVRSRLPDEVLAGLRQQGFKAERELATGDVLYTDARGFQTRLGFYPDGLPARLTPPSGHALNLEHDERGRLAALTWPGRERLELERDSRDNLTALRRPGLLSCSLGYDEKDRPLVIHHPDGSTTRFTWHPAGRVQSVTDSCGATTRFEREDSGKLLARVDALGRKLQYLTDETGALEAVVFPDGSRQEYAVDPDSGLLLLTRRGGGTVLHEFDEPGDRLQALVWADGSRTEFEWLKGHITRLSNALGDIAMTHNAAGSPLTEETGSGKVQYAYDEEERLVRLVTPQGDTLDYEYNGDGRVCLVQDWEGRENQVLYAPDGTVAEILYGNGLRETRKRARTGHLGRARVETPSGRLLSAQDYEYDLCERLIGLVDLRTDGRTPRSSLALLHDPEGRLQGVMDRLSKKQVERYRHDLKGNLTEDCGVPLSVGLLDEPVRHGHSPVEVDGDGNLVRLPSAQGELRCTWGGEGLLHEVRAGERRIRFGYDAFARRAYKTDGQCTWRFGWSGHQLLWEEVRRAPDAPPTRRDYLYFPDAMTPFAFREEGHTYWMQADVRGAIIRVFDEDRQVVWSASYSAYGQAHVEVALVRQPWRLAGQYEDEETGLYYNLARYYSPWLKSYLSLDPRWYEPEATHYSYCRNDPWNRADPTGGLGPLLAVGIAGLVGAAVGAITAAATGGDPIAGALEGAIAGAGALVAVVAGASAGVVLAAGVVASGVGAFAGQLVEQANKGDGFCLKCALVGAGIAALTDLALLGLGKIPGVKRLASALARRLKAPVARYANRVLVKESKWDYFFGRVNSNPHNEARSLQNMRDLETLGIKETEGGREKLMKIFQEGLDKPSNGPPRITEYGTTITRTVEVPPKGAIDIKYFYPNDDMSVAPEISTIIPKIFK